MAKARLINLKKQPDEKDLQITHDVLLLQGDIFSSQIYKINSESVKFSNNVYWRRCSSDKHQGQVRYEIEGHKIGGGHFGIVYLSRATLVPLFDGKLTYKIKPLGKQRIIKIQHHQASLDDRWVKHEYRMLKQSGGLHVKLPTEIKYPEQKQNSSVLVMRMLGIKTISDMRDGGQLRKATTDERIAYTLGILRALKEQVTDKGLVHRDIKSSNFRVDGDYTNFYLVDFGLAKQVDEQTTENVGTMEYVSPEVFKRGAKTSPASDLFSLSYVIGQIWGASQLSLPAVSKHIAERARRAHERYDFPDLFQYTNDLSDSHRALIRGTLLEMHEVHPDKRPCVDKVIEIFSKIQRERAGVFLKVGEEKKIDTQGISSSVVSDKSKAFKR
jgi:serine/threonine-protein kinase LegK1